MNSRRLRSLYYWCLLADTFRRTIVRCWDFGASNYFLILALLFSTQASLDLAGWLDNFRNGWLGFDFFVAALMRVLWWWLFYFSFAVPPRLFVDFTLFAS